MRHKPYGPAGRAGIRLVRLTGTGLLSLFSDCPCNHVTWVGDIAGIAGDDVDMAVHHALAGDTTDA
jgi:hypothetical protein